MTRRRRLYIRRTPEGGNGVMKSPSNFFANLQNLHLSAAPPLPPAPAKSMSKINLKSDPNKTLPKLQKMIPKASQTDPNGDLKSLISANSAYPNASEKTCAHNHASELV